MKINLLFTLVSCQSFSNITKVVYSSDNEKQIDGFFSTGGHTNNWAILVDTSRFWFNYRHIANTLSIYRTVKRLGIPDSNIILMLADDVACNSRNPVPATVYNSYLRKLDLYGDNIEVDYRGYDVNVENFIRLLTGRHEEHTPRSKRLLTDDRSNVLVYMTGHGGEDCSLLLKIVLKFQDNEELGSQDLADAFAQMYEKKRYHELLFMIDTCQAASMYTKIYSPNILSAASAKSGEPSYSHHADNDIGVAVIDRFTYYNLETFEKMERDDTQSLAKLFSTYNPELMHSHPTVRGDLFKRHLSRTPVTDFFGGVQSVELTTVKTKLAEKKTIIPIRKREFKQLPQVHTSYVLQRTTFFEAIPLNFWIGLALFISLSAISIAAETQSL
ncbi:glycosylphosphatidylinositol anchor biosynthesis [Boothiomyces sp. JEL0866]|nr:glycosylphosphatidylinositol anchor biosynthesis [Boothiomyces sp. JEL0866]